MFLFVSFRYKEVCWQQVHVQFSFGALPEVEWAFIKTKVKLLETNYVIIIV